MTPSPRKKPKHKNTVRHERLDDSDSDAEDALHEVIFTQGAKSSERFIPSSAHTPSLQASQSSRGIKGTKRDRTTFEAPPGEPLPPSTSTKPVPVATPNLALPERSDQADQARPERQSQGASRYMADFYNHRSEVLDGIARAEAHVNADSPCPCGRVGARRQYHCRDCHSYPMACADCFLADHKFNPFHWALEWMDAGYFEKRDLSSIWSPSLRRHYAVTFGHEGGGDCPSARDDDAKPVMFTVVDTSGVHSTCALFCRCFGASHRRSALLLSSQILPGTFAMPATGFTFNVLRDFHQQARSSKKSLYDYVDALARQTNPIFPNKVPDVYQQFLRAQRIWRAAIALISSGQCHDIDSKFPYRPKGNIVSPCFACPEYGFNVSQEDVDGVEDDMDHVQLLCLMLDGHFGLQRLAKVDDPDDHSLLTMLGGQGLFPDDQQYTTYLDSVGATSVKAPEKSTCSNFNAVSMQNKHKFANCVITGVVGAECARHCCFLSLVDLQAGEKYANTDYALAQALRRVVGDNSLERAKAFRRIVVTYDVACQYSVHLKERMGASFPGLSKVLDFVQMFVPKFHLEGHKDDCRYRYALEYYARAGRLHGEGIEQTWSEGKQAGGNTRQMNHGHRHDTLTDLFLYWNDCKNLDEPESLAASLQVAREKRAEFVDEFLALSVAYGKHKVTEWEKESIEPKLDSNGEWTSVFRVSQSDLPSQESVYKDLLAAEGRTHEHGARATDSNAQVAFINMGLQLHRRLAALNALAGESQAKEEASVQLALSRWRKQQVRLMPALEAQILDAVESSSRDATLFLPSDVPVRDHKRYGLTTLAEIEYRLREGEAYDAISLICQGIKHKMVLIKDKRKHSNNVDLNTRSIAFIKATDKKIQTWASNYRRSRAALLTLKNVESLDKFPILKDEDLFFKNAIAARELGSGTTTSSWIWSLSDPQQFQGGCMGYIEKVERAQWFRTQADMMRWVEECEMLEEEFRRVIRALNKMGDVWMEMAESDEVKMKGAGYVAYARQQAAGYRARQGDAEERFRTAGGEWKPAGVSLSSWLRARRPQLNVDWDKEEKETKEYDITDLLN